MYYSFLKKHKSNLDISILTVHNSNLSEIPGKDCSLLVGKYGCVILENEQNFDDITNWGLDLGYHKDNKLPNFSINNFVCNLKYFPDNEEILLIHNPSNEDCEIEIFNSLEVIKKIVTEKTIDTYDDMWIKVDKPKNIIDITKNITEANNFPVENKSRHRPSRNSDYYIQKILPRHPLRTQCLYIPLDIDYKDLEMFYWTKNIADSHISYGLYQALQDPESRITINIKPKQSIILDQIICQFKIITHTNLNFLPFWYKTEIRKDFNYPF